MRLTKKEVQPLIDIADEADEMGDGVGDFDTLDSVIALARLVRHRQAVLDARTTPVAPEPAKPGEVVFGELSEVDKAATQPVRDLAADLQGEEGAQKVAALGVVPDPEEDHSRPEFSPSALWDLATATLLKQLPGQRFLVNTTGISDGRPVVLVKGAATEPRPDLVALARRLHAVFGVRIRVEYACDVQVD